MVDSLLQDPDPAKQDDPLPNEPSFQARLDELLDTDLSFSLQNGLRKKLVSQEVSKPHFYQAAILIDVIVSSLEYGMHVFLQRTTWLSKMRGLGPDHPGYTDLLDKSRKSFLHIVSGGLGTELIDRVMNLLGLGLGEHASMGFDASPERLAVFFKLVIASASDVWRRMVFDLSSYPYKIFQWLAEGFELDEFVRCWDEMRTEKARCDGCVDFMFSSVILSEHPQFLGDKPRREQEKLFSDMKALLAHVASGTPANSDTAEVKHGNMQWSVSKRESM